MCSKYILIFKVYNNCFWNIISRGSQCYSSYPAHFCAQTTRQPLKQYALWELSRWGGLFSVPFIRNLNLQMNLGPRAKKERSSVVGNIVFPSGSDKISHIMYLNASPHRQGTHIGTLREGKRQLFEWLHNYLDCLNEYTKATHVQIAVNIIIFLQFSYLILW